jgi:hypothetical protein
MKKTVVHYSLHAVLLIVLCGAALLAIEHKWKEKAVPAPQAQFAPAPQIPAAQEVKVVTVPGPTRIVTKDKVQIIHDLKLPDEIAKNPNEQVVATAQVVEKDKSKVDAIAVENTQTGETQIDTKIEARPFFSFLDEKEIGARAGLTLNGLQGVAYARWTFARTGSVYYAIYGEAASPPFMGTPALTAGKVPQGDAKMMLDISYRW